MRAHESVVDPSQWRAHCAELVAGGATMLDFLAAVDEPGDGQVEVLVHLVDVAAATRHLVRTRVDRDAPVLDSLVPVLPGVGWHEREAHEMVGVVFGGNEDLRPLLTRGGAGFPLRRTTALPARVNAAWPGAVDPADRPPVPTSGAGPGQAPVRVAARPRARLVPPGIPAEWDSLPGGDPGGSGSSGGAGQPGDASPAAEAGSSGDAGGGSR